MIAITLWEPWATAIALQAKLIETRSWPIAHRGLIAIHAAKRWTGEQDGIVQTRQFRGALWPLTCAGAWVRSPKLVLPLGCIVAVANLVACRRVEELDQAMLDHVRRPESNHPSAEVATWTERDMGNYDPGRYGWILEDVRALARPVACEGKQGPWIVPKEIELAVLQQLPARR